MTPSIYWHDYETFGSDPRRDRASQFAGLRTDHDLNEIGEPLVIYCKPARDMLPHPQACLITGITPQLATRQGLPEAEFIRQIHEQFTQPQTCVAGYNSIRFDDELSRQLLYRNFYDPYEREWKHGNSRWDIIDTVRLCHAVRPEGIVWPLRDDGSPSFRLEELTAANGIGHEDAHDALSDVRATIALARLIRAAQPRLYQFSFDLRSKHRVHAMLDVAVHKPVLHVSSMYPATQACIALVMPLAQHPTDNNGVLLFDLRVDPAPWLKMSVEQLRASLFTPRIEMGETEQRLPVKVLHTNRCPVIAPPTVLEDQRAAALGINMQAARLHWQAIEAAPGFISSVREAFMQSADYPSVNDPDFMLYSGGFFSDADKRRMGSLRQYTADELRERFTALCSEFSDPRLPEMLFRYRARNFPQSLASDESARWRSYCRTQLYRPADQPGAGVSLTACRAEIESLRQSGCEPEQQEILLALEAWAQESESWVGHE